MTGLLVLLALIFFLGGVFGWLTCRSDCGEILERHESRKDTVEAQQRALSKSLKELAIARKEIVDIDANPGYRASYSEWLRGRYSCPAYPEDPNDPRIKHIRIDDRGGDDSRGTEPSAR
jgi:hypothetical protein